MRRIALACILSTFALAPAQAQTPINPYVSLETTMGDIVLELFPNDAPITVANFLMYVDSDFYDGLIFHRVVDNFVIQGGGFDEDLVKKDPNDGITNESDNGLRNETRTLSMALTSSTTPPYNPIPDSGTSQFFINLVNNTHLNYEPNIPRHTVFGEVSDGWDIVTAIADVDVETVNGFENVPVDPIIFQRVQRLDLDLAVTDPCLLITKCIPEEELTLTVEIENRGLLTARNTTDPNDKFTVALYLMLNPSDTAETSTTELLGSYQVTELAGQSRTSDTITFTAPADRGDYYLLSVVDDANDVLEFVETNNTGAVRTLQVEPNMPDLIIAAPNSSTINAEPGESLDITVALENSGGANAVHDSGDPCDPFYVTLYQSSDPCLADPTALADFTRTFVASRSDTDETLTVNAPDLSGAYYLYSVADDGNNVLEFNEDNNQSDPITLTVAWEPNDVYVSRCQVIAGYQAGQDMFMLSGTMQPAPDAATFDAATDFTINLGPYQDTVPASSFRSIGAGRYLCSRLPGGITLVILDLNTGAFTIMAQQVDLTGLTAPIDFEMAFADYRGIDEITETIINGAGFLPMRFSQGVVDNLRVETYVLTSDRPTYTNRDTLTLFGSIATEHDNPDIEENQVTVEWGSTTFSIPGNSRGLQRLGTTDMYLYSRSLTTDGQIIHAAFDFSRHTFRIFIRDAISLPYPPQDFRIQVEVADGVVFDETIEVQ